MKYIKTKILFWGWKDSTVRKALVFLAVNLGSNLSIMYGPWSTSWAQSQMQVESTARYGPKITTAKKYLLFLHRLNDSATLFQFFSSFSSTLHQMPPCYLTTFYHTTLFITIPCLLYLWWASEGMGNSFNLQWLAARHLMKTWENMFSENLRGNHLCMKKIIAI